SQPLPPARARPALLLAKAGRERMLEETSNCYPGLGAVMFRLLRPFLLASVLLIASSLFAQDAMPTTPYYPLKIGNTWTYKTKEGNKFVMKVIREEKVNEVPCARVGLMVDSKEVGHEFISVTSDGVFRNGFGAAMPDQPVRILKLPLKADESWEIKGKALG